MILQALYEYYQKHLELPRPGFEDKEFKYMIIIDEDGHFNHLECLLTDTKKKCGQFFSVPQSQGRSGKNSWQTAYLLWDHYGYVLGYAKSGKNEDEIEKNAKMAELQHKQFVSQIESLPDKIRRIPGIHAILEFYRLKEEEKVMACPEWTECAKIPGCNLSFRLRSQPEPVFADPNFRDYVATALLEQHDDSALEGCCLITGEHSSLTRLMSATAIPGGKSNASLVSFQTNSGYDSYGKVQCYNAPIGMQAEFACTTALKALLSKESKNKFSLGDTTAVFWEERKMESFSFEELIPALACQPKDKGPENVTAIRKLCEAVFSGKLPEEDKTIHYYFLGLAPNIARISVRFWKAGTVGELAMNIAQHFQDLEITGGPACPALTSLLAGVVHEYKMENVPPNLTGRMFEAIFNGTAYPETWRNLCLQRVHAEGKVSPLRAAVLKAYVNRKNRLQSATKVNKEISMDYDAENPDVAYQCGALFALLVKAQEEANHDLNATISDRFFASASTRPATVFGTLLKLNRAHLKQLSPGRVINFERMIGEVIAKLGQNFPKYLPPDEQSRFCLGYYQKRQELFTAKQNSNTQNNTSKQGE